MRTPSLKERGVFAQNVRIHTCEHRRAKCSQCSCSYGNVRIRLATIGARGATARSDPRGSLGIEAAHHRRVGGALWRTPHACWPREPALSKARKDRFMSPPTGHLCHPPTNLSFEKASTRRIVGRVTVGRRPNRFSTGCSMRHCATLRGSFLAEICKHVLDMATLWQRSCAIRGAGGCLPV